MAQKSENVQRLDLIQSALAGLTEPFGFRRKGRTLVKTVDSDILQIIALQAGPFEIGEPLPPEAAHLRPNFYGKFTVNLGIFVPEMFERTNPGFIPRGVITDAHCSIRSRLSHITSHQDIWWHLKDPKEELVDEIGALLIHVGIPFLGRFSSRDTIIRDWVNFNSHELLITPVARLDTAMVLLKRGDVAAAKAAFEEHLIEYNRNPRNPTHGSYVRELALRLGLGELQV
ncbi:DUF4304 domain-containing protein [Sphingobium yanoikuyae]|uniref:DUF4304 domain-containing protein n=1 Tax=Sphingobium yanoikuyae TaxID=13690 RepID=UPI002FD92351